MAETLISSHTVTALAPGATESWNPSLNQADSTPLAPSRVMPDRATAIVVVGTPTTTNVTVRNDGTVDETAIFQCMWDISVQSSHLSGTSQYWLGLGASGGGGASGQYKESCRVATAVALGANTRIGDVLTADVVGALGTIDGVAVVVGDRVLVKDEATGANNGIYEVTSVGSGGTAWVLTRTADANTSAEVVSNIWTTIEEGTTNADTGWLLSTDNPIVLNTTALVFVKRFVFDLYGTYLNGGAGPQVITLDGTRDGIQIDDPDPSVVSGSSIFRVRNQDTTGAFEDVVGVSLYAGISASPKLEFRTLQIYVGEGGITETFEWYLQARAGAASLAANAANKLYLTHQLAGAGPNTDYTIGWFQSPTTLSANDNIPGGAFVLTAGVGFTGGAGITDQTQAGLALANIVAATVGVQQFSPMHVFTGMGWKTAAAAGSQQVDVGIQVQPVQAVTNPRVTQAHYFRVNGGSWSEFLRWGDKNLAVLTAQALVALPASTENIDVDFDLSRNVEFSTGAIATQRAFVVQAPTYAFVGASVITTAATLAITGAPITGAAATILNPLSLWVQSGTSRFAGRVYVTSASLPELAVIETGVADGDVAYLHMDGGGNSLAQFVYAAATTGNRLGVAKASTAFALTTNGAFAIGTEAAFLFTLSSNDLPRFRLGTDAEAALSTACYISVNSVLKRIFADTAANILAANGLILYTLP